MARDHEGSQMFFPSLALLPALGSFVLLAFSRLGLNLGRNDIGGGGEHGLLLTCKCRLTELVLLLTPG